ncbi:glycosyltransferase family 4 protein [Streptomyces sp. NPDC056707]|uniref:glycosyltransferase family 4 protein n=1 Tax=unclassified Streptomyces TaxID=2593676 RepID=UPI003692CBC0|nr:glycosyltransferase family 4 protein [Streptomyces sp. NBC_01620]
MKISFLVRDLCHMGGVVSATQNLAGALASRHEVEIVALRKVRDTSYFPLDPRVSVRVLTDLRGHSPASDLEHPLIGAFPKVYPVDPAEKKPVVSRLAELRLLEYLATTDSDVVVSSSPRNTIMLSYAEGDYLRVTQEHSMPSIYAKYYQGRLFKAYHSLDALTAPTPEEAESIGKQVPGVRNRLAVMPNCVPAAPVQSKSTNKVIIAAGLLKENKNFAAVVEAFATVVRKHPDWRLRIYGDGTEKAGLRKQIENLGLHNTVALMGPAAPVAPEFSKGSIFVLPSKREAFGNVIVEALAAGLPVVSTDADHGPRNIITHGEDGFIVPCGDTDAMAEAVLQLVEDDERRKRMGEAAVRNAVRFHEPASCERFEAILNDAFARRALLTTASAQVDPEGSVRIEVGALPPEAHGAEIACRLVGRQDQEKRFAIDAGGTAVVPWHGGLPEGTWELSVRTPAGNEVPLTVDGYGCDLRDVFDVRLPRENGAPALELLLPHRGEMDRLRIRSVVRDAHVEIEALVVSTETIEVEAAGWGVELGRGAVLEAVQRKDKERVLTFPVAAVEGRRITARVDCAALVRAHEGPELIWDMWLRPAEGADRVQVGKLATDVLEPIGVFTFPRPVVRVLPEPSRTVLAKVGRRVARVLNGGKPVPSPVTRIEIRPYFTIRSQLAFKTVDVQP